MEYRVKSTALLDIKSNIIIGLYENGELSPSAQKIDEISQGYLSKLIQSGEIKGKLGQVLVLRHVPNYSAERVFVVGAGKKGEINEKQFKQLIQDTINAVKATSAKEVISYLSDIKIKDCDLTGISVLALKPSKPASISSNNLKVKKANKMWH